MLTIIFYISLIFFADFLNNCQAEIIDCRKQDRDDYYRIVFDLNKKPSYFVYQFGEKIYVRIQNEMEAKINCLNLKQKLYENSIEYEINGTRYKYTPTIANPSNYSEKVAFIIPREISTAQNVTLVLTIRNVSYRITLNE